MAVDITGSANDNVARMSIAWDLANRYILTDEISRENQLAIRINLFNFFFNRVYSAKIINAEEIKNIFDGKISQNG